MRSSPWSTPAWPRRSALRSRLPKRLPRHWPPERHCWCCPGWACGRQADCSCWAPAGGSGWSCSAGGAAPIGAGRQAMHAQRIVLGAASCIDYTCEDVAARALALAGGPVDAIADLVGGTLAAAALPALRPGGQIAAIATPELDLDP